ncbi:MAG: hypothetical protein V4591_05380 [Bdellovibrionota bacterium]
MSTINYHIKIGDKDYEIPVEVEEQKNDKIILNGDDFLRAQWELGKNIIRKTKDSAQLTPDVFNFLIEISGFTNTEVSQYICVEPASVSQWRRKKGISSTAWQTFRLFFLDLFTNGHVTNEIFLSNQSERKNAA